MRKNAPNAANFYYRLARGGNLPPIFAPNAIEKYRYGWLNVVTEPIKCQFCGQQLPTKHNRTEFIENGVCRARYLKYSAWCDGCKAAYELNVYVREVNINAPRDL